MNSEAVLGLHELHVEIGACVEQAFPHAVWVAAEIISLNENRTGHCYLELIEKEEDGVAEFHYKCPNKNCVNFGYSNKTEPQQKEEKSE